MTKLLADLDAFVFMACSALEETTYQVVTPSGEVLATKEKVSEARDFVTLSEGPLLTLKAHQNPQNSFKYYCNHTLKMIDNVMQEVNATSWRGFVEKPGSKNFRYDVAFQKPYKGKRSNDLYPRPVYLDKVKQYFIDYKKSIESSFIETDDALCIVQTRALAQGKHTVIGHNDKDIMQCQGDHFRLHKDHRVLVNVKGYGTLELSEDRKKITGTGDKFFFAQVLLGDPTDHYGGLKGCGPARAYESLANTNNYEEGLEATINAYKQVYEGSYLKYLLEQARLAFMLREPLKKDLSNLWDVDWRPGYE